MTFDPSNQAAGGSGAILRALGSLIAALGADGDRAEAGEVLRAAAQQQRFPAPSPAPSQPAPAPTRGGAPRVEAEMLLADARQRAERILQDSMERATDLLNRERPSTAGAASAVEVETIRRSVDELVLGMREVQTRLARIESIISRASAAATAPAPQAVPPVSPPQAPVSQRPAFSPPIEDERRPGGLSVVSPERPRPSAPPPPPSALPPMRGGGQPAAAQVPLRDEPDDFEPVREPLRAASAADVWQVEDSDDVAGVLATFTPADGAVQLRAAPVSGFQGLMRVQDALQRLPAVRSATVEAYSQGEARLRVELAADVDSDEIAEGLGAALGQSAVVEEASEAERSITIALG